MRPGCRWGCRSSVDVMMMSHFLAWPSPLSGPSETDTIAWVSLPSPRYRSKSRQTTRQKSNSLGYHRVNPRTYPRDKMIRGSIAVTHPFPPSSPTQLGQGILQVSDWRRTLQNRHRRIHPDQTRRLILLLSELGRFARKFSRYSHAPGKMLGPLSNRLLRSETVLLLDVGETT